MATRFYEVTVIASKTVVVNAGLVQDRPTMSTTLIKQCVKRLTQQLTELGKIRVL